jgi:diguanylate cyclase (GGDEF)-like protein
MREAKIRQIPASDVLSGLANCHGLFETVKSEIKRSERSGREFAVLIFDLNGMKQINTCYGHLTGDRALCRLANIIRRSCRVIDTAARYGDDKIAIVLPECGAEAADTVERRISERLSIDREEPLLSVSVGIAGYPRDGKTLDILFQVAVRTLCQKKERAEETASYSGFLPLVSSKHKGFVSHLKSIPGLMRESRRGPD